MPQTLHIGAPNEQEFPDFHRTLVMRSHNAMDLLRAKILSIAARFSVVYFSSCNKLLLPRNTFQRALIDHSTGQ